MDNKIIEKTLFLKTLKSFNFVDKFVYKCFLCYYYEIIGINENYWINFQRKRYKLTKNILYPHWYKSLKQINDRSLTLEKNPLNFKFNIILKCFIK